MTIYKCKCYVKIGRIYWPTITNSTKANMKKRPNIEDVKHEAKYTNYKKGRKYEMDEYGRS